MIPPVAEFQAPQPGAFWIYETWDGIYLQWDETALNPDGSEYSDMVACFGGPPDIVVKAMRAAATDGA